MKKLFAVLLALTLVLSMGTMAFAADGSITIENAISGAQYDIYKMLSFAPSNEAGDKGIYTIVPGWENFFNKAPATNYFTVTTNADQTTVALKKDVTDVDQTLAKAAIQYAKDNSIGATKTESTSESEAEKLEVKFTGLDLGYYAIDTTVGTLCALTPTNINFKAFEKNEKPDIDKYVEEDKDNSWGKVNDADIGQTVNYKSTITVGLGATNYIMHDTMEAGLTFDANSIVVKLGDTDEGETVEKTNYTVTSTGLADGCTFEIDFNDEFIAGLKQGDKFTVYYSATLNENANIVVDGNDNTVYLTCGEKSEWETIEHKTTTYTWKMDVLKYTNGENNTEITLKDAEFELQDKNGVAFNFVPVATVNGVAVTVPTYKVVKAGTEGAITKITTDEKGKFEIVGLDEGSYKLLETKAPNGYNKLDKAIDVTITSTYTQNDYNSTVSFKVAPAEDELTVKVLNNTGSLLPETGGIGTTIFYIVGITLMLGAGIILISKKRMASFA